MEASTHPNNGVEPKCGSVELACASTQISRNTSCCKHLRSMTLLFHFPFSDPSIQHHLVPGHLTRNVQSLMMLGSRIRCLNVVICGLKLSHVVLHNFTEAELRCGTTGFIRSHDVRNSASCSKDSTSFCNKAMRSGLGATCVSTMCRIKVYTPSTSDA